MNTGKRLRGSLALALALGLSNFNAKAIAQSPGTFTATGSMTTPRMLHTATLLADGRVLIAGGRRIDPPFVFTTLSSAEIYDPRTGTFTATGNMTAARLGHTATLLPSGKVLMAGGAGASAELYDPDLGAFSSTANMTTARNFPTATLLANGKVLIAGGGYNSAGVPNASAELYDPSTGTFAATGGISAYWVDTATLLPNGKVLITRGAPEETPPFLTEVYDPSTGLFSPTGKLITSDSRPTATLLINGKVLVAGGGIGDGDGTSSSAELYDPVTGTFVAAANLIVAREQDTSTLLRDGRVLLVGGHSNLELAATAELYDPVQGTFTRTGNMAGPRELHTATLLQDGRVLIAGGDNENYWTSETILTSAELYTPPLLRPFTAGGQGVSARGGSGSLSLTFLPDYNWTASTSASWLTFNGPSSGTGSGTLSFQAAPNDGTARSATITVAGFSFTIEQAAGFITGLNFIGSMPHIAAEENWTTEFTLVNKGAASAQARLSLFGDPTGALMLPLLFPQQAISPGALLADSIDRTLLANASLIVDTTGPQTPPVQVGSGQLAATGPVDGFAIFHLIPSSQEAVVPLETRNASSYLLAFDNTGGVTLGVAVENVSALPANIGIVIRDDNGVQIGSPGTNIAVAANGHTSFVVSDQYPVTANLRGTIEFDTPAGGRISVLGIRTTPSGSGKTLTTVPALANVGTNGGSIAHIATGNDWQTTFVLVNTGARAAQAHLKFFADDGSPLSLPIGYPQQGAGTTSTVPAVDRTLAAGATLIVESVASPTDPAPTIGSAQLTTDGNVGGFVIFRNNRSGQEAAVPLESRNASSYVLAFDNTANTATGVAINSVSAEAVNIPIVVRTDAGVQIATDLLSLAPNGHLAFTLATDKYLATAGIRGTIEFDTPPGGQIGVIAVRIPVTQTFTSLPALSK